MYPSLLPKSTVKCSLDNSREHLVTNIAHYHLLCDLLIVAVNRDVRRHGREVYSTQMTEHVAEEIDLLYYEAATPALDAEADVAADNEVEDSERLYVADDLTLHA